MKSVFISFVLSLWMFRAVGEVFSVLPDSPFVDTEVSTHCPVASFHKENHKFQFSLSFQASLSNNVQVAFGTDSNSNRVLEVSETELVLGWDCGSWILSSPLSFIRYTESSTEGEKTLSLAMLLRPTNSPHTLSLLGNEQPLFESITTPIPTWMYNIDWDIVSLTARGSLSPQARFSFRVTADETIIYFR